MRCVRIIAPFLLTKKTFANRLNSVKYKGTSELQTKRIQDYDYKKNLYFFIHDWFRNGATDILPDNGFQLAIPSYYPLNNGLHSIGNLVVRNFELYKIDSSNNPAADPGIAYIDPNDTDYYSDSSKEGAFIRLERGTHYRINEDLGFIRMQSSLQNEIIGARFDLTDRSTGNIVLSVGSDVGENGNDGLILKIIKPKTAKRLLTNLLTILLLFFVEKDLDSSISLILSNFLSKDDLAITLYLILL